MHYVKKPIPVKALQLIPENQEFLITNNWVSEIVYDGDQLSHAYIPTLEGTMKSNYEDYIMEGIHGEHWSIKKDIFEKTYEPWDYKKHQVDLNGNPPSFFKGENVSIHLTYNGIKMKGNGVVVEQLLEIDDDECFWGEVIILCEDGMYRKFNNWLIDKIQE